MKASSLLRSSQCRPDATRNKSDDSSCLRELLTCIDKLPLTSVARSQKLTCSSHFRSAGVTRTQRVCREHQQSSAAVSRSSAEYQLEPAYSQFPPTTGRHWTAPGWLAVFSIVAVVAALAYQNWARQRQEREAEAQDEFLHSNALESEEFQNVLASVRQSVTFQRAVQSMREGDTARAMVELYRVLEQNAICRKPLNMDNYTKDDLEDVYRLHLQNSELPLQYSTLLHLRQLLTLSSQRAEELESQLKGSAYQFSI